MNQNEQYANLSFALSNYLIRAKDGDITGKEIEEANVIAQALGCGIVIEAGSRAFTKTGAMLLPLAESASEEFSKFSLLATNQIPLTSNKISFISPSFCRVKIENEQHTEFFVGGVTARAACVISRNNIPASIITSLPAGSPISDEIFRCYIENYLETQMLSLLDFDSFPMEISTENITKKSTTPEIQVTNKNAEKWLFGTKCLVIDLSSNISQFSLEIIIKSLEQENPFIVLVSDTTRAIDCDIPCDCFISFCENFPIPNNTRSSVIAADSSNVMFLSSKKEQKINISPDTQNWRESLICAICDTLTNKESNADDFFIQKSLEKYSKTEFTSIIKLH